MMRKRFEARHAKGTTQLITTFSPVVGLTTVYLDGFRRGSTAGLRLEARGLSALCCRIPMEALACACAAAQSAECQLPGEEKACGSADEGMGFEGTIVKRSPTQPGEVSWWQGVATMGWKAEREGEPGTIGWKAAREGEWEWLARLGPHSGMGFKPSTDFSCIGLFADAQAKLKASSAAGSDPGVISGMTFNVLACNSANAGGRPGFPLVLAYEAILASSSTSLLYSAVAW